MLNVQSSQHRSCLERTRIFYFMMLSLACLFLSSLASASDSMWFAGPVYTPPDGESCTRISLVPLC
jgi:hypothetical protein